MIRLVAFDLDGTLTRGRTCVEAIAEGLGQLERAHVFERLDPHSLREVAAAREEMAAWFRGTKASALCVPLTSIQLAPGAVAAFARLRAHGVQTAIVSITWDFAVAWFAKQLHADYWVGTGLSGETEIDHFWPVDKARWLAGLIDELDLPPARVAAVGDSRGDIDLLLTAGHRYFVGAELPPELEGSIHYPDGDILEIARAITAPVFG